MNLNKTFFCDSKISAKEYLKNANIDFKDVYLSVDGKKVGDADDVVPGRLYRLNFRLVGGKGGFGSMLRALGAQIEKTTNREACRDLSGRRIRDVNTEQKLKDWAAKQGERDEEKEKKRKERKRKKEQVPVAQFNDQEYTKQKNTIILNQQEALKQGLSEEGDKKCQGKKSMKEYQKMAMSLKSYGVELSSGDDDDSDGDSSDDEDDGEKIKREKVAESVRSCDMEEGGNNGGGCSHNHGEGTSGVQTLSNISQDSVQQTGSECTQKLVMETNQEDGVVDEDFALKTDDKNNIESKILTTSHLTTQTTSQTPTQTTSQTPTQTISQTPTQTTPQKPTQTTPQPPILPPKQPPTPIDISSINLSNYNSLEELEGLGLEALKELLKNRVVKCGGTLKERAKRLLVIKNLTDEQLPSNLRAKK